MTCSSYPVGNNLASVQSFRGRRVGLGFLLHQCRTMTNIHYCSSELHAATTCMVYSTLCKGFLWVLQDNNVFIWPFFRQEALLAAISEKDANIALLELSSSKKKTQDEVAALKREKDRLVQQLKQQVGSGRLWKKAVNNLVWDYYFDLWN